MKTKAGIILLGQGEGIMKTKARIILLGLVMAIALCYANSVRADSSSATGANATASVNLDFQILIPRYIYFRVGTAGMVNTINFQPSAADMATPGALTNGTGGDAGPGAVNVEVITNAGGTITITPTNNSGALGLSDGGIVNYISYDQIGTGDGGHISAPGLSDAGGTPVTIVSAGVTNLSDIWTYTYINPATPPVAGTYGGSLHGGRVTYTAVLP